MTDLSALSTDQLAETLLLDELATEEHAALAELVRRLKTAEDALDRIGADDVPAPQASEAAMSIDADRLNEIRRAINALRLEVPNEVWMDVSAKVEAALDAAEQQAAQVAYAEEGWDWLGEALDALGAKTVFDIAAAKIAREAAEARATKATNVLSRMVECPEVSEAWEETKAARAVLADLAAEEKS